MKTRPALWRGTWIAASHLSPAKKIIIVILLFMSCLVVKRVSVLPDFQETPKWKSEVLERLRQVKEQCGSLCQNALSESNWMENSLPGKGDANLRLTIVRDMDCPALLENKEMDAGDASVPYPIPDYLLDYYSMGGVANIRYYGRLNNIYLDVWSIRSVAQTAVLGLWSARSLDQAKQNIQQGKYTSVRSTYGGGDVEYVYKRLQKLGLSDKTVLVIGSEIPWVEAVALALGAAHVTTLEYGPIQSGHPQVSTMTPAVMRERHRAGTLGQFQVIVSHSSVEHSGLGRYGDALNPWGDLLTIARAWCVAAPDATMYLGVPVGRDAIEYNAHRVYGKMRLSLISSNWEQIHGEKQVEAWLHSEEKVDTHGGVGLLFKKVENFDKYPTTPSNN